MGTIDEIKKMQAQGKTEQEVVASLKQKGISDKEISDSLTQTKIKEAVVSPTQQALAPAPPTPAQQAQQFPYENMPQFPTAEETPPNSETVQPTLPQNTEQLTPTMEYPSPAPEQTEYTGMQPSMPAQEQLYSAEQPDYPQAQPAQDNYSADAYSQYQPYQEQMSSDIITEISEQVVSEKLSNLQDRLEKALDFKTVADAKLTSLNERLKKIEQVIDRLQLSLIQKVSEYVTDVGDIKHELKETQESFKTLLPKLREIHSSGHHKKKPKKKKHP